MAAGSAGFLFVEKNPRAFAELATTTSGIDHVPIELINGKFEDHIADAVKCLDQGVEGVGQG